MIIQDNTWQMDVSLENINHEHDIKSENLLFYFTVDGEND